MRPPGPVTRTCMPPTESPKWSPIACTESRNASSPGLPSRLAKISAPLPSGEYSTRALLMGSAPLVSQALPSSIAALSAGVSAASELYTTMIGVPLASGNDACCSASARLLSSARRQRLGGVVAGHALAARAHGQGAGDDHPDGDDDPRVPARVHQVMMFRMCACPLPAMDGAAIERHIISAACARGQPRLGSRLAGNRVP